MKTTAHTPLPLHRMAVFTPGRQNDDEIRASYIARQAVLDMILDDIRRTRSGSIPQHHLIIGQRGMGKTTLLKRLHVALREEPLASQFIPLGFPEEQYSVDRLSTVFLNCLDSLADTLEREEQDQELIDRIDDEVERLRRDRASDEIVAQDAERTLLEIAAKTKRRPVLLVDNLDLIFERLKKPELHYLRAFLMRNGAPILIGASVHPPEDTQDYDAPFYDHFKPHYLSRLSLDEMREVLLKLAERAGNEEIPARIHQEQGRLHALHALTGGNPRTTRILFEIFAHGFSKEAYEDLEALLDWMTPIYKARFEELADQAQVVVSAIATIWEPAVLSRICEATRLQPNQVSPQLDRLKKSGFIEEVTVDPPERTGPIPDHRTPKDRTGYQLAERFFNIWFLMRQATRRDKRNLIYLTRLIECLHTPQERQQMARDLMGKGLLCRADQVFGLALEPTLMSPSLRADLRDHVYEAMVKAKREFNENIEEIIDPTEIPQHQWEIAELREKLAAIVPGTNARERQALADELIACPMLIGQRTLLVEKPPKGKQLTALLKRVREFRMRAAKAWGENDWKWFEKLLTTGAYSNPSDTQQVESAIMRASSSNRCRLVAQNTPPFALRKISDEAWQCVSSAMQPTAKLTNYGPWLAWADLTASVFSRYSDAEEVYRRLLEQAPNNPDILFSYSVFLTDFTKRYEEALTTLDKVIKFAPENMGARSNRGYILSVKLGRHKEAEVAYTESLAVDPNHVESLLGLGCVVQELGDNSLRAVEIFRKATQVKPRDALAWNNLGQALSAQARNYSEAQDAYRRAIEIDPWLAVAHVNLGNLYRDHFKTPLQANEEYRKALLINPNDTDARIAQARLLADHLHNYSEAESAFRAYLKLKPDDSSTWNTLGNLLLDYNGKPTEARSAYEQSIAIGKDKAACARCNLAYLLTVHEREFDKAEALIEEASASMESKGIEDGIELIHAVVAACRSNWGDAAQHLEKACALLGERKSFPSNTIDDWMRASAVMLRRGYGEQLLELLHTTDFDQRLRPWTEALRAHVRGDRKYIRNAPFEVRESAGQMYDEIKQRLERLPSAAPKPAEKRARRQKR